MDNAERMQWTIRGLATVSKLESTLGVKWDGSLRGYGDAFVATATYIFFWEAGAARDNSARVSSVR